MLKTDQPAPTLRFPLLSGATFDLASRRPETFTLVIFYRGLHCPLCRRQLETDVVPNLAKLSDLGVDTVVVSMDSKARATKQAEDWDVDALDLGYALPEDMARAWGLYVSTAREGSSEPDLFSEPAMTLVRSDGTVFAHWQQSVPFARGRVEDLIPGLEFVLENNYPARGTAA